MKKRLLSLAMCLLMAVSAIPFVGVSAATTKTYTSGKYKYIILKDKTVEITSYTGTDKNVTIPSKLNNKKVTSIGNQAFYYKTKMESVVIPSSVNNIGKYAFEDCYSLVTVEMPNNVKNIGDAAFKYCSCLKNITIPSKLTTINEYTFAYCSVLPSVTVPDSVKIIDEYAFYECASLRSLKLPEFTEYIGNRAFSYCGKLAVINLPENIKHIGKSIFYDTAYYNDKSNWENGVLYLDNYLIDANISNKNADYNIKEGTKIIAVGAFENCDDLKSLTFPESLTTIPRGICNRCNYLTTINVSDNVNYISSYAFEDCTSLENINLGDNIERIGEYAFNNTGFYNEISNWDNGVLYIDKYLISIKAGFKGSCIVKDGTIGIANSACSECDTTYYDADEYEYYNKYYDETDFNYSDAKWYGYVGLTGIKLPASVKYIGSHAFDGCDAMVSVELNEGLQVIGANAFNKCKEIYTIRIPKSVTKIGDAAIDTSIVKVIEGYENSVAQTYAKNNKIQFANVVCKDGKEHTAVTLKAKKSTYFEKGYTTHSACSVCGEDLSYVVYSSKLKLTKTSFSLKSGKKSFKITYKKAKGATGFQVSYKTGKGKWVTKNFNAKKKVTKTIKKLKKGKKYTVKIRVFAKINGKKVYSNRTGTRTVTVK